MNANQIRKLPLVALPLLLAPLAATAPGNAAAQGILKCAQSDGTTLFTDKSCEQFGATLVRDLGFDTPENSAAGQMREPPATATDEGFVGNGFAIKGCARTRGELMAGVRESIARGDVNRLANYYDWNGMGSKAAFAIMDRLDGMVRNTMASASYDYAPTYDSARAYASHDVSYATPSSSSAPTTTDTLAAQVMQASMGPVVYTDGPSRFDAYRAENADVAYGPGIMDASAPMREARPVEPVRTADVAGSSYAALSGTVDASTPLGDGYGYNAYNPRPVAVRVSSGSGGGQRFAIRERAGCFFIAG